MDASSSSSPPVFSGASGAPVSADWSGKSTSSFNSLWLLLLIPIILLMLCLIAATWLLKRRRRIRRQRRSTLRNVTLVMREEEEKREKEEKRLTRGSSLASKLGRESSLTYVQEERQRRYSKRIARAKAREEKELGRKKGHRHLPSESSVGESAIGSGNTSERRRHSIASPPASPLARKVSVKQRDREVAQRVWQLPDETLEPAALVQVPSNKSKRANSRRQPSRFVCRQLRIDAQSTSGVADNHNIASRDVEAEAEAVLASNPVAQSYRETSSFEHHSDGSDMSEEEVITSAPRWAGRRREISNQLSVIGESGLSEGGPSADASRDISVSNSVEATSPIIDASASQAPQMPETTGPPSIAPSASSEAGAAPALSAYSATLALSGGSIPARRSSTQWTPSQRSRHTTTTSASQYTTASVAETTTDDDAASLQTAQTGHTVTAFAQPFRQGEEYQFPTPALVRQTSRPDLDPFTSPISPSNSGGNPFASLTQSSAGGHTATTSLPIIVATSPSVVETSLPTETIMSTVITTADPSQVEASSSGGFGRKLSQVVRLRSSIASRSRGASPTPSNRSASISSVAGLSLKRSPSPALTGESWAYKSHASEWKARREESSSSLSTSKALHGSSVEGRVVPAALLLPSNVAGPVRHNEALRRTPSASSVGRQWLEPQITASVPVGSPASGQNADNTTTPAPLLQRKNSIGVAGSRFKETFD